MLAVFARLAVSVRENERLLEQVQTDHLTGLGNQRALPARPGSRCRPRRRGTADAAAARPERLQALQRHLRPPSRRRDADPARRPAPSGGRRRPDRLPDRRRRVRGPDRQRLGARRALGEAAVAALSASGPGYQLGAACGSVRVPHEAEEPNEALQLADVRMYAKKESTRPGRRTDDRDLGAIAD